MISKAMTFFVIPATSYAANQASLIPETLVEELDYVNTEPITQMRKILKTTFQPIENLTSIEAQGTDGETYYFSYSKSTHNCRVLCFSMLTALLYFSMLKIAPQILF